MIIQWPVVLFKIFSALGIGVLGFAGIAELRGEKPRGSITVTALASLLIASIAGFLQIGKPSAVMSLLNNLSAKSAISLEVAVFLAAIGVGILYATLSRRESAISRVFGALCTILAGALPFLQGCSYMSLTGMPEWNVFTLPFGFTFESIALAGLLYLLLNNRPSGASKQNAARENKSDEAKWVLYVIFGLSIAGVLAFVIHGFVAKQQTMTILYWILVVLPSIVAAGITGLLAFKPKTYGYAYVGIALFAATISSIAFRIIIYDLIGKGLPVLVKTLGV